MKTGKMNLAVFLAVLVSLIFACDDKPSSPGNGAFVVWVNDPQGMPIAGAWISGGFDWDWYLVETNSAGWAMLPSTAAGYSADIYKNNYFSINIPELRRTRYTLEPTPWKFDEIGEIEGSLISIEPEMILTLDYLGKFRIYGYDDSHVTELSSTTLPGSVSRLKLYGDTLWYSTFQSGIYVYLIQNPYFPEQLYNLDIPGYSRSFAKKDTIIAVTQYGIIEVFSYSSDSFITRLDSIGGVYSDYVTFSSDYLISLNYNAPNPVIFDSGDPANIIEIYAGDFFTYGSGFMYGDKVIMPEGDYRNFPKNHLVLDLSDPADPTELPAIPAEGILTAIIDDSTATGRYSVFYNHYSIFHLNESDVFEAVAVISENNYGLYLENQGYEGVLPPFYVFDNKLYLMSRPDSDQ